MKSFLFYIDESQIVDEAGCVKAAALLQDDTEEEIRTYKAWGGERSGRGPVGCRC